MYKNKHVVGFTGPSVFSSEVKEMIEEYFGAIPLYINSYKPEDLEYIVSQIDWLCLGGGSDISPTTLGRPMLRNCSYSKFDIARDRTEIALIDAMIKNKKPILAICRGMQLLGCRFGFNLIPDISGYDILHGMAGDIKVNLEKGEFHHFIKCLPEYTDIYFDGKEPTNSFHHQALKYQIGKDATNELDVVAIANTDTNGKYNIEIIEMFENVKLKIVGTQFHCELYKYGDIPSIKALERFKSFL